MKGKVSLVGRYVSFVLCVVALLMLEEMYGLKAVAVGTALMAASMAFMGFSVK